MDEATERRQVERDRADDARFVEAGLALLDAGSRQRAAAVRLQPGDSVAALLGP